MAIEFSELVQLYRRVDFDKEVPYASYAIKNQADVALIKHLTADESFEDAQIDITKGEAKIGQIVDLSINQPKLQLGWLYRSFQEFVKGDISRVLNESATSDVPYYITDLKYYSKDQISNNLIDRYNTIKSLLIQLARMCVYADTVGKKLIFFSKYTFELSYDISSRTQEFTDMIRTIDQKSLDAINDLHEWLSDEETSKHINEKKSILSFVLANIQSESNNLHLLDIILDIQSLYKAIRAQYDLYLEDFKYEKFVRKLEENSQKFVQRINESISKLLSQVLALPIAAATPIILKGTQIDSNVINQVIVYASLIAYATICYFALIAQRSVLDNIKVQVEQFEKKGKVPSNLKPQWQQDKKFIDSLIQKQEHLYWAMISIICLVIFYSSIRAFMVIF